MKGGAFLESCVRDIKRLLLDADDSANEYGPDGLDADVVMLWDDNGRKLAAGTSYGISDATPAEFDQSYAEIVEWLDEDS